MKKLLALIMVLIMLLTIFPNFAFSSDTINASDILSLYGMSTEIRSDDFTALPSLDTTFWKTTGSSSIKDGTLKIGANGSLAPISPIYRTDYAIDILYTFPQFTKGTPDYNGPKFRLNDGSKEYYGLMQWNNFKYYNSTGTNTSVAPNEFKTTYAANVKIDDGMGTNTKKERIYLESIDYRLLIILSGGTIHTYLLDPATGEQILQFNDYTMTDTNVGGTTAFSLLNTLSYEMDVHAISMYTKPVADFTLAMESPEYIASNDRIVFNMDAAVDITSVNGLTVTDSNGEKVKNVNVSTDNTKLTVDFDKEIQEKYKINIKKAVFGNGTYTAKDNYEFIVYTLDEPKFKEDFSDTSISSKLSIPANSTVADGVLKMGQYTQNEIKIDAENGVTEFDLTINDTMTNPELWYLFRIVEKTNNNIVSPDANNSEVLKMKFTDNGLNVTLLV